MAQVKSDNLSFEENMQYLRTLVSELEKGELPLEEAVSKYEDGMKRAEKMSRQLKKVAARITVLEKKKDTLQESPFEMEKENE